MFSEAKINLRILCGILSMGHAVAQGVTSRPDVAQGVTSRPDAAGSGSGSNPIQSV